MTTPARDGEALTVDELTDFADAAWWDGRMDEFLKAAEAAHRLHVEAGRPRPAALLALMIALTLFLRDEVAVSGGWFERAGRLLADLPDCPEQAYFRYIVEVEGELDAGRPEAAAEVARAVRADGLRHDDPNLVALGTMGEARALLRAGEVDEGLRRLDEAMLAAVDESLSRSWAGNIYCHVMAVCHELHDVRRAAEWTRAAGQWFEARASPAVFTGILRVFRSRVLQVAGDWDRAEREATQVVTDLAGISVPTLADAHYQLGELHRLRGRLDEAEASYRQARALGRDPQPGLALLHLARGRAADANTALAAALAATDGPLERAPLVRAQVEVALAAGDHDTAADACGELERTASDYGTSGLEAAALHCRGAVALEGGQAGEALGALRAAGRRWHEVDARHEVGRVRLLLGRAYRELGDERAATDEFTGAREEFERLGAVEDLRQVDRELGQSKHPGGLTDREVEVLALVATGITNREIAERLVLSERTIDRHMSNILRKLNLRSRTAAAAFAFEHRLVPPGDS